MQVSSQTWRQWYISEHLFDFVDSHTAARATLYEEIDLPGDPPVDSKRRFLAMYQTDFEECLKTHNYREVRTASSLFEKDGANSDSFQENGDFDARYYKLTQTYDPNGIGEAPPPNILTVEAQPKTPEDYDNWFGTEHISQLAALTGYRRTLRYKLGPMTGLTKGDGVPLFLAVHEMEDAKKWMEGRAEAAEKMELSEWVAKNVKGCRIFTIRGWKLVHNEGYRK